tara:strand:- start:209 stop:406 length:198 start_codon:yes stop_codon:yes gene_type:complete
MTRYQNSKMIEVEQEFYEYLNDDGMTNEQAIVKIKEQHGEHWEEYIRDVLKKEVTTIHINTKGEI